MDFPEPPIHLSSSSQQLWRMTVQRYELAEHHLRILQLLCEAWDRTQQARTQLDEEGLTVRGAEGGVRSHPAAAIERDSRLAVARLIRELDLDIEPPRPDWTGPPPLRSNNRGGQRARKAAAG